MEGAGELRFAEQKGGTDGITHSVKPARSTHFDALSARRTHLAEALCCALEVCVYGAHVGGEQAAAGAANVDALQAVELQGQRQAGKARQSRAGRAEGRR